MNWSRPSMIVCRLFACAVFLTGAAQAQNAQHQQPAAAPQPRAPIGKPHALVGLTVVTADGIRLGVVEGVNADTKGAVKAIHIPTGGFLGFGAKLVAVPDGKFTLHHGKILLGMTAVEVSKLPELKNES